MTSDQQAATHASVKSLMEDLRSIVGDSQVLHEPAMTQAYCIDWTRRFGGPALCVVRPGSVDEVAAVVKACVAAGVPLLPQGGNTGLVGGSVPAPEGPPPVIVSTRRLSWIDDVDELAGQVSVGAGATLGNLQRHVLAAGWEYGVDLAARDAATVGGTVATNAGGIRVLAFGMTRMQITGIEAVLPDGSVISHMSGLAKDNTGLDLAQLLCGSEGTLGIITAVRVRLHRPYGHTSVALVGCSGYDDALQLISTAVSGRLVAAEVLDSTCMRLAHDVGGMRNPLSGAHEVVLLLEVADGGTGEGLVGSALEERDAVLGIDGREIARIWEYRERQAEFFDALGIVHKLDVSVPLNRISECAAQVRAVTMTFDDVTECGIFGHLADGNIHVEIVGPSADEMSVDIAVLEIISRFGGAISAEHGIGRVKTSHLGLSRTEQEIAAMRSVKSSWDPDGFMNPGVLFS